MIKLLQFISVCAFSMIFFVTFPVFILATKPFVSLQYALLPNSFNQKLLAQESLAILASFQDTDSTQSLFSSIKKADQVVPLYTPLEVDHLVDVKKRFDVVRHAAVISFVLLLLHAYALKGREFSLFTYKASLLGLILVFAAGVLLLVSWNWLFIAFHKLIFPAGNWSFSPDSGLIQLFPEIFWFRFGVAWIVLILLMLLTATLISKSVINRSSHI